MKVYLSVLLFLREVAERNAKRPKNHFGAIKKLTIIGHGLENITISNLCNSYVVFVISM